MVWTDNKYYINIWRTFLISASDAHEMGTEGIQKSLIFGAAHRNNSSMCSGISAESYPESFRNRSLKICLKAIYVIHAIIWSMMKI